MKNLILAIFVQIVSVTGYAQCTDYHTTPLSFTQLWQDGPSFAVINYDEYYSIPSSLYYTWEEALQIANTPGKEWRLPTATECQQLISKCKSKWTSINGIYGRTYTGRGEMSGNSIFLPATGFICNEAKEGMGQAGFIWTQSSYDQTQAFYFYWYSGEHHLFIDRKYFRYPILLVVKK